MRNSIKGDNDTLFHYSYFVFSIDPYVMSMDDKEFRSSVFQRVFQYLRRHIGRIPLDRFTYPMNSIEGRPMDCLEVLLG